MIEQSNTNKVFKGVSTQTIITILIGIIEIVGFSIMSRLLSQQDFGYYAAITAISSIFAVFSDAGIGSAIVQRKMVDQKYIDNAFSLSLIFGLLGTLLLLVFSGPVSRYVADETMKLPLMLVSITLLIGALSSVNFSIMHRKLQFLRMGIIRMSASIITTITAIVLALKGFGYYSIIAKAILNSIIVFIFTTVAAQTKYHLTFDLKAYKEIFGFGGWLQASSFFRKIAEEVDRLMMSRLFNVTTLGMYSRPKEFINNMTGRLCDIFDSSLFPVLSSIQDEKERLVKSYQTTLYYLNIVGLMITVSFIFNSELIIRIFLGAEWMNVNTLFIILSFSGVVMLNGSLGDIFLRSLAYTKQQFFFRILQALVSIVLIVFATKWGILAVAFAYLIAYLLIVIIKLYYISNQLQYGFKKTIGIILDSFRVILVFIPPYTLCVIFMPNTLLFNELKLAVFCAILICAFILFPVLVGNRYKEEMHSKVILFLKNKVLRKS